MTTRPKCECGKPCVSAGYTAAGTKRWKKRCGSCENKRQREYKSKWAKENRDPEKHKEYQREWRAKQGPDFKRPDKLMKRYGITPEEYNQMFVDQNGVCAICGNKEVATHKTTGRVKRLAVDHCHETGKVRGLLCQRCNHMIGLAKDNTETLSSAIEYLSDI